MTTLSIAKILVHLYLRANDERVNPRPIDRKVAAAEAQGGYKVAHAAGYGHTPTHVEITVLDTFREITAQKGPRPLYLASNNSAQKEWDQIFIDALGDALDEIW